MSFGLSERAPPGAVPFNEKRIAPHIPVIDKSKRDDGTFSREDFTFDKCATSTSIQQARF
jgi:hypothetical protein